MNGRTNSGATVLNGSAIALEPISEFSLSGRDSSVLINWADPVDKYTDPGDELVIEWDHTVIIRKQGSAPTSPKDGTVVIKSYTRNQYRYDAFTDTGLTNDVEYYYAAYSVTTVGAYSDMIVKIIIPRMGFVYYGDSTAGNIAYIPSAVSTYWMNMRESFNHTFWMRNVHHSAGYYDSDLLYNSVELNNTRNSMYYHGTSTSDENHIICMSNKSGSTSSGIVELWDTDMVYSNASGSSAGTRYSSSGKTNSYFILAPEDARIALTYEREDLTYLRLTNVAMDNNSSIHLDGYDAYTVNAGDYLIFYNLPNILNENMTYGSTVAFDDDLVYQFPMMNEYSDYFTVKNGVSVSTYGVFFNTHGTDNLCFDSDLVISILFATLTIETNYYYEIYCNGFAVIMRGVKYINHKYYPVYDFSLLDTDLAIVNRGIDKMKYRRDYVMSETIDNYLIITSMYYDQLSESAERGDSPTGDRIAEVYTF